MIEITVNETFIHVLVLVPGRTDCFCTNFYFKFYVHIIFVYPVHIFTIHVTPCKSYFFENIVNEIPYFLFFICILIIGYVVFVFCKFLPAYHEILSIFYCFTRVNIHCTLDILYTR